MGSILAAIDNAKRQAARRARDLYTDPRGYLQQLADTLANSNAGTAPVISKGELTNRRKTKAERQQEYFDMATNSINGGLGVIKSKGGNWLSGSVENALSGLKKDTFSYDMIPMLLERLRKEGVPSNLFKLPGEEAQLENLIDHPLYHPVMTKFVKEHPLNNWIEGPLTKYVRNDMATPGDPVRALAERGVLHVDPGALNFRPEMHGKYLGPGQTAVAQSLPAKSWEGVADNVIASEPASTYQNFGSSNLGEAWINALDPNTPFYRPAEKHLGDDLGFNHLIDELSNSINPESGLPRHLQFPVDRLNKVTVPQAVERVAQINAWRAAQKAELDAQKANNAATHLHKEYPDDPRGMRWVELKQPELSSIKEAPNEDYIGAQQQSLKDALKYEGDTMGHCVGGYCDDVASGKSKIYSLRDKKGQPHVTIEVEPGAKRSFRLERDYGRLTPEERALVDTYEGPLKHYYPDQAGIITPERLQELYDASAEPSKIIQIKGKGNAKPNDDYLPFVQDFVKSGQWSDVGDLQNTGLYRKTALTPEELSAYQGGDYLTMDEIKKLREGKPWTLIDDLPDMFASGGLIQSKNVQTVGDLSVILNQLRNGITNNA